MGGALFGRAQRRPTRQSQHAAAPYAPHAPGGWRRTAPLPPLSVTRPSSLCLVPTHPPFPTSAWSCGTRTIPAWSCGTHTIPAWSCGTPHTHPVAHPWCWPHPTAPCSVGPRSATLQVVSRRACRRCFSSARPRPRPCRFPPPTLAHALLACRRRCRVPRVDTPCRKASAVPALSFTHRPTTVVGSSLSFPFFVTSVYPPAIFAWRRR